jgi:hypothetical protein
VGDLIRLRSGALGGQLEGRVTEIGITYLRLDTGDGILNLPNAQVLAAAVGPSPQPTVADPAAELAQSSPAAELAQSSTAGELAQPSTAGNVEPLGGAGSPSSGVGSPPSSAGAPDGGQPPGVP